MSIARAWTLRRKREEPSPQPPPPPTRAASMRFSDRLIDVRKISSPVALLSTTNMLSYNAPDVSAVRAQRKASFSVSSGSSSRSSADESDTSSGSRDTALTDVSSIASSSPTSSPDAKHKDSYFHSKNSSPFPPIPPRLSRSVSTSSLKDQSQTSLLEVDPVSSPEVPLRAASHSKKAHEVLARKRSLQTMSRTNSISSIASSSREKRSSIDFFSRNITDAPAPSIPQFGFTSSPSQSSSSSKSTPPSQHHPFGKELMQLDEIAEEFGGAVRDVEREADLRVMRQKGLVRFCADDYMREIQPLFGGFLSPYASHQQQQEVTWI